MTRPPLARPASGTRPTLGALAVALAVLTVLLVVPASGATAVGAPAVSAPAGARPVPVVAQSGGDAPTTTTLPEAQGPTALPRPNSGTAPQAPGDRGGWLQYLVLGLTLTGMGLMFARIVVSARKTTRLRAATAGQQVPAEGTGR